MNTKNHHRFRLCVWTLETCKAAPHFEPVMEFDESDSFDEILLTMLALDQLGLYCSLTCDTWTEYVKEESEDLKND